MTQNLIISDKTYLPSAEIAKNFGYTPDYVSRLARESKVVATCVNRKWFICEDSFNDFVRSLDLMKETRSDELKKQRKVDRLVHAQEIKKSTTTRRAQSNIALAQTCAIMLCGALVGLLGWSVSGEDITLSQINVGVEKSYSQISSALTPNQNPFSIFSKWSAVASVQESVIAEGVSQKDLATQTMSDEYQPLPERSADAGAFEMVHFSDEVDIRFVADETGAVRPIVKSAEDGQEYQMVLAPITEGG
jgi:hypothetical protein